MAICKWCDLEMLDEETTSCPANRSVAFAGHTFVTVPYAPDEPHRCHDCGIAAQGKHHPGCDMERCPACGGQLISCFCWGAEE